MASIDEIREKERRVRDLMDKEGLNALALSTIGNFAWFTCGGSNYVGIAAEVGVATAVITRDAKYIVCDNIEAGRIADEEVADQGFEFKTCFWYEAKKDEIIREIAGSGALGSDTPISGAKDAAAAVDPYRQSLTHDEIERYKWLGRNAGECLALACRETKPGMSEHQIAGELDRGVFARGMVPVVTLIAADERIIKYRHPIPTDNKVDRCVMLVSCARRWGLIVSATRLVYFGPLSGELRVKHEAVARVDGAFIAGTKPGANIGDIFKRAVDTYRRTGFAKEWQLHHQGGPTGYKAREFRAHSGSAAAVVENQAFAWNPSITGTKSEDTIIATANGPEIISQTDDWPMIDVDTDGITVKRPNILVR